MITVVSNIVVTQKHTKTIVCLNSVMGCLIFAGAQVQQGYELCNLFNSIAKSVFSLAK